ncbi:MAG: hypothetical protein GY942_25070 [Aestuariibacter sp.]|nr:hypothetical protein [Aestuariibacter sp.]
MAADYQLPLTDVNRVRFYDGQFLQDQDFVDEQKHHVGRQNRHHRTLHVAGVAEGLTLWGLKSSPEPEISVTKGMAIDADGRQIILGVRTKMESARWPEGDWSDCWLYIAYHQEPDPNSLPNTTIGVEEETRWLETPYIFTHVGDSPLGIDDSYDGPDWSAYLQSSDGPPPRLAGKNNSRCWWSPYC